MDSAVADLPKPRADHLTRITPERAKELGQRGNQARIARAMAKKASPVNPAQSDAIPLDAFTARRLLRVRKQLDAIDDEIDAAISSSSMVTCPHCSKTHPDERDRVKPLVEAQSRLSEQERFLANRPGPGTRKPAPERQSKSQDKVGCTIIED